MNIRIVKIIIGFKNKPYIANYLTQDEINKMHIEKLNFPYKKWYSWQDKQNDFDINQGNIVIGFQEGYFIQNIEDEPLDLSCVETDNNIKELKKYEIASVQLKSLIFLLFKNKQSLKIDNGAFYISNLDIFKHNNLPLDVYLSNFYFEFDKHFNLTDNIENTDYNRLVIRQPNIGRTAALTEHSLKFFGKYILLEINNTFNKELDNYNYYWPKWGKTKLEKNINTKNLTFCNYILNNLNKQTKKIKKTNHVLFKLNSIDDKNLPESFNIYLLLPKDDLDFNEYYNKASKANHILGTHMKNGVNIYTDGKASLKNRTTNIETFYNGQTIKNPIEFNMPNAKGKISLLLGKKFKEELIDNMDFGDLTFDKLEIANFNDKIAKKLQKDNSELICNRISKANCNIKDVIINCKELYKVEGNIDKIKTQKINTADFININNLYLLDESKGLSLASNTSNIGHPIINNLYITKNKQFLKLDTSNSKGKIEIHIKNLITTDNSTECSILINCWGNYHPHFKIFIDKIDSNIKILKAYFSVMGKNPILGLENPSVFCLNNKTPSNISSTSVHIVKDKTDKYGWHERVYEWWINL